MRRIAYFETSTAHQLMPIALLRPVFELLCGHYPLRQRINSALNPAEWGAVIRPPLVETYQEEHPAAHINDSRWLNAESVLLVNGRCLIAPADLKSLQPSSSAWIDDTLAAVIVSPSDRLTLDEILSGERLLELAERKKPVSVSGTVISYPWDLIHANPEWIKRDFELRKQESPIGASQLDPRVAIVGDADQVFIDPTAKIDPFVVLDASAGPVWIDQEARVQAFTRVEGPAYIGPQTQLFRANVREGCSFGPVCRLGGEIEESIVHGFANKYHDGFLGHSYVCPWVNLGALTTNSDLKNDYSLVSVPLAGESIKSGSTKVGSFFGDHSKTALCSLFNTGSSIGVMSLILPGGGLLPKHIPSFTRIWHGRIEGLPDGFTSAFETARRAMARRNQEFTPAMERLLKSVYETTKAERELALLR